MSETEIIISLIDQASAGFTDIASSAESSFANVSEAADSASTGMDAVETATNSTEEALNSVDSTSLNEASSAASSLGSNLSEVSNEASNTSTQMADAANSTSMLQAAGAGVVALGLGTALTSAVEAAGEYSDSWSRLGVAVGSTSSTVQTEWSGAIKGMQDATGRGAGAIRGYITTMSLAGVESQSVISSSFTGVAGAAFATGSSIDAITSSFQRVVSTGTLGNRQLISLGLTSQDVFNATGMSVDQVSSALSTMDSTSRAAYMSQIMNSKYGQDANDAYKTSWQGVTDKLGLAEGYISRIFGGLILPIAIPAMTMATGILNSVAGAVGSLPGPLQAVASIITVGIVGWVMLYTTWTTVSTVAGAMGISLSGLTGGLVGNTAATDANTAAGNSNLLTRSRAVITAVASQAAEYASAAATAIRTTALEIQTGVSAAALGAAAAHTVGVEANTAATNMGVLAYARAAISLAAQTVASGAQAAATYAVAAAQWLLNAAMDANPIMIVVIAIIALVAILYYLYNNNEMVRNAINWLWASLQQLGGYIMGGLMAAWNALVTALSPITSALGLLWAAISQVWSAFASSQGEQANGIFASIAGAVMQLWSALSWLAGLILDMLMPYLQILWEFMSGAFMAVWTTISGIVMAFINYLSTLITILANLIAGNITVGQALQQVWTAIQALLAQVFIAILLGIGQFTISLINYGIQAASGLLNAFIAYISQLPGIAWGYFLAFLSYLASLPGSAAGYAASVGSTIVSTISSYLSSLPSRMYQWGVSALQSFVNAIINSIPGLRAALDAVSSLFPHSPPKEGPLSEITVEKNRRWMESIGEALKIGVEDGSDGVFEFVKPQNGGIATIISNVIGSTESKAVVELLHKFEDVPDNVDEDKLLKVVEAGIKDGNLKDTLLRMFTVWKREEKMNTGA